MREKRKLRKLAEKIESQHLDAVMKNRSLTRSLFFAITNCSVQQVFREAGEIIASKPAKTIYERPA